jgi:hypothetical protein
MSFAFFCLKTADPPATGVITAMLPQYAMYLIDK